jgi:hypothetical protein
LRVGQLRAEDLRERLTPLHVLPQFGRHTRDPAADDRCHHDLFVRIGLHHTGCSKAAGHRPGRDCGDGDPGAVDRFLTEGHHDVR